MATLDYDIIVFDDEFQRITTFLDVETQEFINQYDDVLNVYFYKASHGNKGTVSQLDSLRRSYDPMLDGSINCHEERTIFLDYDAAKRALEADFIQSQQYFMRSSSGHMSTFSRK